MESYPDHAKRSQKDFASLVKISKQILQHLGAVVNRFTDLSDTLGAISQHEPTFMREPLIALSSVAKTLAAEWSVALKGVATLPDCFDMKDDNARIQASIKNQAQAQHPFHIQANHEFIINSAVFERTRATNIQRGIYNFGHALLYMGARSIEAGTNFKTLAAIINPQASILDVATRLRDLDLGANVTMSMLLRISAEEIRNYPATQLAANTIRYAGQLNTYKVKQRSRKHRAVPPRGPANPYIDRSETSQDSSQGTFTGYQNVTITSPIQESGLNHRVQQKSAEESTPAALVIHQTVSGASQSDMQQSKQIDEYQQQITQMKEEISSLQAQMKEQLQMQMQIQTLNMQTLNIQTQTQAQMALTSNLVKEQVQDHRVRGNVSATRDSASDSLNILPVAQPAQQVQSVQQPLRQIAQQHYEEETSSTPDTGQAIQMFANNQQSASNPFMKGKTQQKGPLINELSNFVQESELLDTQSVHGRESTEVSQVSASKRASNVLNPMTRSTTEIDNMGDEYDLPRDTLSVPMISEPTKQNTPKKTDIPSKKATIDPTVLDFDSSFDDFNNNPPPRSQQKQQARQAQVQKQEPSKHSEDEQKRSSPRKERSKGSTISEFLRDPSSKSRGKSVPRAAAGLYEDEESLGFSAQSPKNKNTEPEKGRINVDALDDDELDFF